MLEAGLAQCSLPVTCLVLSFLSVLCALWQGCWVPSLQRGGLAISTFSFYLVLYEGMTQIHMVSSEMKCLIFYFCLYLMFFSSLTSFLLCSLLCQIFCLMLPFLFFFLTALISTDISSLNMQPPALNVIRSKPTLNSLGRCFP